MVITSIAAGWSPNAVGAFLFGLTMGAVVHLFPPAPSDCVMPGALPGQSLEDHFQG